MAGVLQALGAAVQEAPELDEAHALLADHYRQAADEALRRRDAREHLRCEALVREHDRGAHTRWLAGQGDLTVLCEPDADVALFQIEGGRRRTAVLRAEGLRTPILGLSLPSGSCRRGQG